MISRSVKRINIILRQRSDRKRWLSMNEKVYFCPHCIGRALIEKKITPVKECTFKRGVVCYGCKREGSSDDVFYAYPGMKELVDDNATTETSV